MKKSFVGFVFFMTVLLSCSRIDSPVSPTGSPRELAVAAASPGEIRDMIRALFPPPVLSSAALLSFAAIERDVNAGRLPRAQRTVGAFITLAMRGLELDLLSNPPGPQTTEEGLAQLFAALLEFVGMGDTNIPPGALTEEGAIGPCGPQGCLILTGTEFAGVQFPPGALDKNVIVFIERLDDFPGPLNTSMDQYPLFYRFETIPETSFLEDVIVGLCVVDPPDPFAPDPDIVDQLQLAHSFSGGVQILPLADAPFLDCTGAQTDVPEIGMPSWIGPVARLFMPSQAYLKPAIQIFEPEPLYAYPGKLGAAASSFSPFAAVDTESGCDTLCETF